MVINMKGYKMIKFEDNICIDSDGLQYITKKYCGLDKNNEPTYRVISYHNTLKQAISRLIQLRQYNLVSEKELTLEQALNEFKRIADETEQILKENIIEETHE